MFGDGNVGCNISHFKWENVVQQNKLLQTEYGVHKGTNRGRAALAGNLEISDGEKN